MQMQSISSEAEVDKSLWKILVVALSGVASAAAFSYFLQQFFVGSMPRYGWIAFACAVAYLVVFSLQPILIKRWPRLALMVIVECVALCAPFYGLSFGFFSGAFAVAACVLLLGSHNVKQDAGDRVKVRIVKTARQGVRSGLTALSLFVAIVYVGGAMTNSATISFDAFTQLILPADPILGYIYPGVSLMDTFGNVAKEMIRGQLSQIPEAAILTEAQKNLVIAQETPKLIAQAATFLGIKINANDTVVRVLYESAMKKFSEFPEGWQQGIWIGIGLLIFSTLRSAGVLLAPLIAFVAFLLFELLLSVKFVERFLEPRSREFVIMK